METGAMFVRLINGTDVKFINIQHVRTIERLYFEPEGSVYANGWALRSGEYDYIKITDSQFQELVELLPIANC